MKKNYKFQTLILTVLITIVFMFVTTGLSYGYQEKSSSLKKKTQSVIVKVPQESTALGPQPEPPDKPGKGSKALGPQPEPPDRK